MFEKARIKLTVWYLFIIMLVSISFSAVIYQVLTMEMERFAIAQRFRIERKLHENDLLLENINTQNKLPPLPLVDPELLLETKQRLLLILACINGGILVFAGGIGFFLAGKTLRPIGDMLEEQNRFITDSSHELRTPLTALKSAMEVHLRDKILTLTQAKKLIRDNIKEVDKLQLLSDELLLLTQYQKPHKHMTVEKIVLSDVLQKAVSKVSALAKQKNITLTLSPSHYAIEGNMSTLSDLFVIFLDNAIKYSPKHSTIGIFTKKTDGSVRVSIKDHGIGIDKKDIPLIFNRFYRADAARSKVRTNGYGLGLSIAKKIVEQYHGTITVQSELHKGSTFIVQLPRQH